MDGEEPNILAAVMVHGQSIAKAIASSSRYAKIRASERALDALSCLLRTDFRLKYGCDCQSSDAGENTEFGTAV